MEWLTWLLVSLGLMGAGDDVTPSPTNITGNTTGGAVLEFASPAGDWHLAIPQGDMTVGVTPRDDDNWVDLHIQLHGHYGRDLRKGTRALVGQNMDVKICGVVVIQPKVQTPLYGGQFVVNGKSSDLWVQQLSGQVPCP